MIVNSTVRWKTVSCGDKNILYGDTFCSTRMCNDDNPFGIIVIIYFAPNLLDEDAGVHRDLKGMTYYNLDPCMERKLQQEKMK